MNFFVPPPEVEMFSTPGLGVLEHVPIYPDDLVMERVQVAAQTFVVRVKWLAVSWKVSFCNIRPEYLTQWLAQYPPGYPVRVLGREGTVLLVEI